VEAHEPERHEPNVRAPRKEPWFGNASAALGMLAFGMAILSLVAAPISIRAHYQERREDYGGYAMGCYYTAFVRTMVPAFGCVSAGFVAVLRGERSGRLLLPALVWLYPVLLCGLLVLIFVVRRLAMN
jgi:hypothetical protein